MQEDLRSVQHRSSGVGVQERGPKVVVAHGRSFRSFPRPFGGRWVRTVVGKDASAIRTPKRRRRPCDNLRDRNRPASAVDRQRGGLRRGCFCSTLQLPETIRRLRRRSDVRLRSRRRRRKRRRSWRRWDRLKDAGVAGEASDCGALPAAGALDSLTQQRVRCSECAAYEPGARSRSIYATDVALENRCSRGGTRS
jgi:hypothetical protein